MNFAKSRAVRRFRSGTATGSLIAWAAAGAMVSFAAPALAAEGDSADPAAEAAEADSSTGSDILVTTRRRDERLQDVPLSVSAVGAQVIRSERLVQLQDFAQKIPNFNPRTQNPRTSALSIRGAGGLSGAGDGSEGGVGLIVDDVFYTHIGFAWGPLYDLAAVEVARGPQGTLLGKNTTVGAVIVRTALPSFTPSNAIEISAGNYGSTTVRAYSTGTLVDDVLAYRVSFYKEKNDGFYRNNDAYAINDNYRGIRLKDTNRWAIRGQLLFQSGDVTDRLIVDYHKSAEYNNYAGIVAPVFTHKADGSTQETYEQRIARLFGITNIDHDPTTGELTNISRMTQNTRGISNHLDWTIGDNTLSAITAYREFRLYPRNSQGTNGLTNYSLGYDVVAKQYSQELRFASAPSTFIDYQIGAYFLRDTRSSNNRIIWGKTGAQFYGNNASYNPDILNGVEYDQLGIAKTTSFAGFGQATWHATPWFDLTGGIRYTHEKREGSNTATSFGGASGLSATDLARRESILISQFGGYFTVAGKRSFDSVSWLINPSIKVSDDILLYASTARGVKSGAINTVARPVRSGTTIVGYQPVVVDPEVSRDWELGIKTSWLDKTLNLNVNLYWNDIHDYQGNVVDTSSFASSSGSPVTVTYLSNIPHVRLKGVEVEGNWAATPSLNFTLAGAISDVKYVKYADAAPPADQTYTGAPATIDLSGTRIEGVPRWTLNAGVRYDHAVGHFQGHPINGFFYVNEFVTGKTQFLSPASSYSLFQKTYGLTNAGFGFRREDDSLRITVYALNLFDVKYTVSKALGSATAPATWTLGDPRTYGVSAALRF